MMRPIRYKEAPKKAAKAPKASTASQRKAGAKGAAGKKWYEQTWGVILIIVIIVGGIVGTFGILIATNVIPNPFSVAPTPTPEPTPTTTTYSMHVWDGALNEELDTTSFSYDLYGTNTSDFGDFDLLESGADIGDISNGDLTDPSTDDDYTTFWVRFDGVQPHDDDIYGEDNDRGARTYGERWATIAPNIANNLIAYETPDTVTLKIWDADTFVDITTLGAGELPVGTNVTMVVLIGSEDEMMYVPYFDPQLDDTVEASVEITFDLLISSGDFKVSGITGSLVSPTTYTIMTVSLGSLMPGMTTLSGVWRGPTILGTATEIETVEVLFGSTTLDAIT